MAIPTLETERLILREVTLADLPAYEKYFIDYEVIKYLSAAVPWPYPQDGVKWFLENLVFPHMGQDRWLWGIFLKKNPDELIGAVDLWREGKPENRGFWLGKKFWGQGIMTEAVASVMDCAFNQLGFEKMVLANAVGNVRSRRVKEKTEAKFLGTAPAKFVSDEFCETELWEITKDGWKKR